MFEIILDGLSGALAAALAYFLARILISPKDNPRGHRILVIIFMVVGFQVMRYALGPQVRSWRASREIDQILAGDQLFSTVLSDNPTLRQPTRDALIRAYASGDRRQAAAAGAKLLGAAIPKYLSKASDQSLIRFTRSMVNTLSILASRDPNRCYQYLFPNVAGPTVLTADEDPDDLMAAMREVVISAHDHPISSTEGSANGVIEKLGSGLAEKYGDDVALLKQTVAPGADRAKVCTMTIDLYTAILALPQPEAGSALRALNAQ